MARSGAGRTARGRLAQLAGVAALGALLAGCGAAAGAGETGGNTIAVAQNGPIVYSAESTGKAAGADGIGLYTVNPDGSGRTRLTSGTGQDYHPAVSPDGELIAYSGTEDARNDLWVMNADGTGARRLTTEGGRGPAFSPDSERIVYTGSWTPEAAAKGFGLYLVNVDGTGLVNLTKAAEGAGPDLDPVFSPDGQRIAFIRYRPDVSGGDVYVINADGTGLTRLTTDANAQSGPSFSPDGTRLVFTSEDGASTVTVMNADGSGLAPIATAGVTDVSSPVFSPDGAKIAFAGADRAVGAMDVYVMNSDGTGRSRVTAGEGAINGLDWAAAPQG